MERGIVVYDGKNPRNDQQRLVVVSGKMNIRGEDFFVTAGLRDGGDGKLFYDHELLEVERADEALTQSGRVGISGASGPGHRSAHLNDYTIDFLGQDASVLEARARGFRPADIHCSRIHGVVWRLGKWNSTRSTGSKEWRRPRPGRN
jgi:hypothetical protein